MARMELNDAQTKKLLLTMPTLLCIPEGKINSKLEFMQERLQLTDAQLRKVVTNLPASLGMLPDSIDEKLCYLEGRLGLSAPELRKLVCTLPGVLSRSVEGTMAHLFRGKFTNYVRCINVDDSSLRDETFYDLQMPVKGCKDIYASFDEYVR